MQTTTRINRNRFRLALVISLVFLAGACKKDDAPNPGPQPVPQAKLQEYRDGEDFIRFQYNSDGTVNKATVKNDINTNGDVVDFTLTYNAAKVITEMNSSSGERIVPVYENNVLKRADIFMGGERTAYTTYQFVGGNMTRATIYLRIAENDYAPLLEFSYEYNAAGNVTEGVILVSTDNPGEMVRAGHVELQHDNKSNPLFAHKEFLALLWQGPSKNNVTKESVFDDQLILTDEYVYNYTYKANGLPEKADVAVGLPGQPQTAGDPVKFTYQ